MNSSLSPGVPFTEFERIAFFIFCCGFYPVHDNLLSAGRTFIKLKSCAKLKRSNNQDKKELRAFEVHIVEGDQNPCQTISRWLKFKDIINKVSENIENPSALILKSSLFWPETFFILMSSYCNLLFIVQNYIFTVYI